MRLVRETRGGEEYVYRPLGDHIVAAPEVCGGRPTFKYTRIEAAGAVNLAAGGLSVEEIADRYGVPMEAVTEALRLAAARLNGHRLAA